MDGTYTGDIDTSNNTFTFCDSVRAAWDPNIKTVTPLGGIEAGELLTYTIQFENLGNDTAFNIHIIDTLSDNVDAGTFELLSSTHPVNAIETGYGTTKIIKFDFPNIKLPDASSPNYNKG